jgi:iron complex outermembrane receptor protein
MNYKYLALLLLVSIRFTFFAQSKSKEQLEEVIINSARIDVPFSKNSKQVVIITTDEIKKTAVTSLTDLLQGIEGIDVIKRGTNGMQADIKIRGGNFQQTLILIDGFKTEDPQTGHHTMNMMIPLENIERIEIIKGASARIFGQNAFTGAINIVTKKVKKDQLKVAINTGSFNYLNGGITASKKFKKSSHQFHFSHQQSDGYRFNTDFKNNNYFLKSEFETKNQPIQLITSFANRDFGAQYFYTSPASNFTEYEETQTSLVGISTKYIFSNLTLKPKIYWKRNQDMFLLKREDSSFSRNFNISNKMGAELNSSYKSSFGTTGLGVDIAKVSLASSNLGNQNRIMLNAFFEHRYVTKNEKLDFTPGISVSYFSDFGFQTFPGLDVGYKVSQHSRLFWNIGSSYRVPSYTEMYINIPNFLSGNKNLKPETAFTQELGYKYATNKVQLNASVFYRVSKDLIDYVKETAESPFYKAENLRTITTKGFELSAMMPFEVLNNMQQLKFGYTFLEDNYVGVDVYKSRYLLNNTIKHHLTASLQTQFFKKIINTISYRYIERPINKYHVLDTKLSTKIYKFNVFILANNILDTDYYEKEFVKMPRSNFEVGVEYRF